MGRYLIIINKFWGEARVILRKAIGLEELSSWKERLNLWSISAMFFAFVAACASMQYDNLHTVAPLSKLMVTAQKQGEAIDRYLEKHHAPMKGYGRAFVDAANMNGIDWRLLPAICMVESNCGASKIARDLNNPFGVGDPNFKKFDSLSSSIFLVAHMIGGKGNSRYYESGMKLDRLLLRYNSENKDYRMLIYGAMVEIG